jgi:hypothetical protein
LDVAAGQQYLTSLLTVQAQPTAPFIFLPLQYNITHLQHDFETAETYYGYVPSSWLKFAIDDPGDSLLAIPVPKGGSPIKIPVPVPYLPTTPSLQTQTAGEATSAAPPGSPIDVQIQDALAWNYEVTLSADLIAEDSLYFNVAYNQAAASLRAQQNVTELFDALAEYQERYPSANDLYKILDEAFGGASGAGQPIIDEVVPIIQGVANAWPSYLQRRNRRPATSTSPVTDQFYITISPSGSQVTLSLFGTNSSTGTIQPVNWPSQITLSNLQQPWTVDSSTAQPAGGGWYQVAGPTAAQGWTGSAVEVELTWSKLNILDEQCAAFTCWVKRNSNLVQSAVNPDFVLVTQQAMFSTPGIPLIERDTLETIVPGTQSLDDILGQILQPLANVNGADVDLHFGYSYALVQTSALSVTAPTVGAATTFIRPTQVAVPSSPASIPTLASGIATEIRSNYAANPMPQTGAKLHIGLSLSGAQMDSNTLLVQLYDIPIDVSSVPSGWLTG